MLIGISSSTLCDYVVGEYTEKLWEGVSSQEALRDVNYEQGEGPGDCEWDREMRAGNWGRKWN